MVTKYVWLGYEPAAEYLGVTPRQLRQWVEDGRIESAKLGLRVVFTADMLDAFVVANTRRASA